MSTMKIAPVHMMYLHPADEPPDTLLGWRLPDWPEIAGVDVMESEDQWLNNFSMGGPFETYCKVASIKADDRSALSYLTQCVTGVQVIAVRGKGEDPEWTRKLNDFCELREVISCPHDRHSIVSSLGRKAFWDGLELLTLAAEYLRGPAIDVSEEAMRTESTLTRALEALAKTGYKTPKR